jgi:hypothetical protein
VGCEARRRHLSLGSRLRPVGTARSPHACFEPVETSLRLPPPRCRAFLTPRSAQPRRVGSSPPRVLGSSAAQRRSRPATSQTGSPPVGAPGRPWQRASRAALRSAAPMREAPPSPPFSIATPPTPLLPAAIALGNRHCRSLSLYARFDGDARPLAVLPRDHGILGHAR